MQFGDVNRVSLAFANAPLIYTDDEDEADTDTRLFVCCLNPYGKLPVLLLLLCFVVISLHAYAVSSCDFVDATFDYIYSYEEREEINVRLHVLYGLRTFNLIDCTYMGELCPGVGELVRDGCKPFPIYWDLPSMEKVSRVFGILTPLVGLVGIGVVAVGICFFIKRRTWRVASASFLLASFCQGMVLTYTRSEDFQGGGELQDVEFSLGPGGICAAVAVPIWFALAAGSAHLARTAGVNDEVSGNRHLYEISRDKHGETDDSNA